MTSKIVGYLTPIKDGYMGELTFAFCPGKIALKPVTDRRGDSSPHYRVLLRRHNTGWDDYGAAWDQTIKSGAYKGERMLSLAVDHELLRDRYSFAVFFADDDDADKRARIVWSRPGVGQSAPDFEPENVEPAFEDELPF